MRYSPESSANELRTAAIWVGKTLMPRTTTMSSLRPLTRKRGAVRPQRAFPVPVISMTITLAAVYAPIGFLEGLTGALFKEFALTLAGAVIISGVVALTLSPMMCSKLLRHEENPSGLAHKLDLIFDRLKRRYQAALHGTLNTRPVVLVFAVLVLCLIPVLLMFSKNELAPEEDQGIVFLFANAPQPTNLNYVNAYTDQFVKIFKEFPEYYSSFQINGFDGVQSGIGGFLLKPWDERERTQMELLPIVQGRLNDIPGLQIFGFNLPSLPGTGQGLPFQFVVNTPNDYESLLQVADRIKARAMESGQFAFLNVDLAFDKPEVVVDIDPFTAGTLTLGVIYGAFTTEVFRGAFQALDRGQIEAAYAAGMSRPLAFLVRQHLAQGFSLEAAAAALATSKRTLARRLQEVLGKTPVNYVQDLRIERAVHLLKTSGENVDRIAEQVGYRDGVTLRTLLRRKLGKGLREIRG